MKKVSVIILAIIMCLAAASCSSDQSSERGSVGGSTYGGGESTDYTEPDSYEMSDDSVTFWDLNGWWYLSDEAPTDMIIVPLFRLDAQEGIWITYDEWGEEAYVDIAYLTEDEMLCLEFELGDAYFIPDGDEILLDSETGDVMFVKGPPPEEDDSPSGMDGNWYKNGDLTESYYVFDENGCREIPANIDPATLDGIVDYKRYLLEEREYYGEDDILASGISIDIDDPYVIDTYILSDDETYFYVLYGEDFYMRENVIGTPHGDEIIRKYWAISTNWGYWSDGNYERLDFYENDLFAWNRQIGMASVEMQDSGSWSLEGETLTLYFSDGDSEELILTEDTVSLTVERYGLTFTVGGE